MFPKHYKIVEGADGLFYPQHRFLAVFWVPCAIIDNGMALLPRAIRCGSTKDAMRVCELHHQGSCPGREKVFFYEKQ
jgi:hypothetical protein